MAQTSRKRRRQRTDDKDGEFVPISKRINNLHIRSTLINSDSEGQEDGESGESACSRCHAMGTMCPDHLFAAVSNGHAYHDAATGLPSTSHSSAAGSSAGVNGLCSSVSPHMPVLFPNGHAVPNPHDPYQQQRHLESLEQQHRHCANGDVQQSQNWNADRNQPMYEDGGGAPGYEPDMSQQDNPFYYQVNELLYELHVARTQRLAKM